MPTYNVGVAETYATISLALAAIPGSIGGTGVHEVVIEAGTYNENLNITKGANSVDYIVIRAKAGDEHKGNVNAGVQVVFSGSSNALNIASAYSVVQDLVVRFTPTNESHLYSTAPGHSCKIINVIGFVETGSVISRGIRLYNAGRAYKCVVIDKSELCRYGYYNNNGNEYIYNSIAVGCDRGFSGTYQYLRAFNCVAINARTSCFGGSYINGSNCAATDGTALGPLDNQTLEQLSFKNISNDDYHINPISVLNGAGIEQSSLFTTDIDGHVIDVADWPIGIDYIVPTCWTYTARYKNSKRLFRKDGPGVYPTSLRVPANVDVSTGQMVDEGQLIDPSKYSIN